MKEVYPGLYVGNEKDYYKMKEHPEFSFVLAAKNPFHKNIVGYEGKSCDKSHPEYLIARRKDMIVLNMVDAPSSLFFSKVMIDEALNFIDEELHECRCVMIVCNRGESRSASIALLYLIQHGVLKGETLEDCEVEFLRLYPEYNPGKGIRGFVKEHFEEYQSIKIF